MNAKEQYINGEKRYDGTLESLKDKSRCSHSCQNQHTEEELKIINRTIKNIGLVVLWMKLRRTGYTITIQGLYYAMQRMKIYQITSRENF